MDCFVSVEQFLEIEFLLQPMFQIQKHSVQKSISGGVFLVKIILAWVASVACLRWWCASVGGVSGVLVWLAWLIR